jgi:hypothetical protein
VPTLRHYVCEKPTHRRQSPTQLASDVQYLIRFENLEEDFNQVCAQIGISPVKLPTRNRSSRRHYSEYYDEATKRVVGDVFAEETAFGGYRFEAAYSAIRGGAAKASSLRPARRP